MMPIRWSKSAFNRLRLKPTRRVRLGALPLEDRTVPTVFTNSATILLPADQIGGAGISNPYPSTISVTGLTGQVVTGLTVKLPNLTHTNFTDLDVMLVAPNGISAFLMSDNGDTFGGANVSLTFDDAALGPIGNGTVTSGVYQISNFPASDSDAIPGKPGGTPVTTLAGFKGLDPNGTWELRINDDAGGDVGTLVGWEIDITARANKAPVTVGDTYVVNEDNLLTVNAKGVLTNDTDGDNDPITAVLITPPTHGQLNFNEDGSFDYNPRLNFFGSDTFSYRATDGINPGNAATVTINVAPINDEPVAVDNHDATQINRVLFRDSERGVLSNDLDADLATSTVLLSEGFESLVLQPFSAVVTGGDGTDWTPELPAGWSVTTQAEPGSAPDVTGWRVLDIDSWIANQGDQFRSDFTKGGVGKHGQVFVADGDMLDDYTPTGIEPNLYTTRITTREISLAGVMPNTLVLEFDSSFRPEASGTQFAEVDVSYDGGTTWTNLLHYDTDNTIGGVGSRERTNEHVTLVANNPIAESAHFRFAYIEAGNDWWWAIDNVTARGDKTNPATLSASIVGSPTNGKIALSADGSYTYTPNTGYTGPDSFSYRVFDGTSFSNVATVTIATATNVTGPVANVDVYSVTQGGILTLNATRGVLGNDTDGDVGFDNGGLTAALVAAPTNGKLTLSTYGNFVYTPNVSFFGSDSFTYTATDGTNGSKVATVKINVVSTNLGAPTALNDSYSTNEDVVLTIAAPGLLVNDSDPDNNAITAVLVSGPTNGTLALAADGSFKYTPKAEYNGTDTFTYKANDFLFASGVATVTITVNAVNDAPIAIDDKYSVPTGGTINISTPAGALGNDRDDGTTVTLLTENFEGATLKAFASAGIVGKGDGTDWTDVLPAGYTRDNTTTPAAGAPEYFGFTLQDVDSWIAASKNANRSKFTRGGVGAHGTALVADPEVYDELIEIDPDLYNVFFTTKSISLAGLQANSLKLELDSSFRSFDTMTASVEVTYDAGATWSNIQIIDSPSAGGGGGSQVRINEHLTLSANNPIGATAAQFRFGLTKAGNDWWWAIDNLLVQGQTGTAPTASLVAPPSKGAVTFKADGSFDYKGNPGVSGVDTFTYKSFDGTNFSNVATVTITIDNVAPVTADDSYTIGEDKTLTVTVGTGVVANDTDGNLDPITTTVVRGPRFGAVMLNANGSFDYVPQADFYGTDSFTYKATDGVATSAGVGTVTITVTAVDDAPVATNDTYSVVQPNQLVVPAAGILTNDSTGGRTQLTLLSETFEGFALQGFQSKTEANGDGTDWTEAIPEGWVRDNASTPVGGPVEFFGWHLMDVDSWVATEGNQNRGLFTKGGVGAHGTVAVADGDAYDDGIDIDPDQMNSFFRTPNLNLDGTVADTLVLEFDSSYRPEAVDQIGLTDVSFDGGSTWTNLLTLTPANSGGTGGLLNVNKHYQFSIPNPATGTVMFSFGYTLAGNDFWWAIDNVSVKVDKMDVGTLTATKVSDPANGTVNLLPDGSFTYTPIGSFSGTDSFTYKVSDGTTFSNVATVTLNVVPSVTGSPDSFAAIEDQALSVPASGVLLNDFAVSVALPLTAKLVAGPSTGTLTAFNADGSFEYTPAANFNGPVTFTYTASDGTYTSAVTTVTINVGSVPDLVGATKIDIGTNQRSMVRTNTVTFDSKVTLSPGAFVVSGTSKTGTPIAVTVDTTLDATGKVVTLSFRDGSGLSLLGGSLVDGNYSLVIDGTKITDAGAGSLADADGNGTPGGSKTVNYHRYFGDADGDKDVDNTDFVQFRIAFGTGTSIFDADGDGDTDNADFVSFRSRFGTTLP